MSIIFPSRQNMGQKNTNSGMQLHDQQKQWHKLIKHKTENTLKTDQQRLAAKKQLHNSLQACLVGILYNKNEKMKTAIESTSKTWDITMQTHGITNSDNSCSVTIKILKGKDLGSSSCKFPTNVVPKQWPYHHIGVINSTPEISCVFSMAQLTVPSYRSQAVLPVLLISCVPGMAEQPSWNVVLLAAWLHKIWASTPQHSRNRPRCNVRW